MTFKKDAKGLLSALQTYAMHPYVMTWDWEQVAFAASVDENANTVFEHFSTIHKPNQLVVCLNIFFKSVCVQCYTTTFLKMFQFWTDIWTQTESQAM